MADEIHIHNMSGDEIAEGMIKNARRVCAVLRPFVEGPFSAMVIPAGSVLKGPPAADRQFIRMGLKGWNHESILNALNADGWVSRELFEELTNDVDEQGNALRLRETLRIDANVATVRCNHKDGYLMVIRIPEGEEDF